MSCFLLKSSNLVRQGVLTDTDVALLQHGSRYRREDPWEGHMILPYIKYIVNRDEYIGRKHGNDVY